MKTHVKSPDTVRVLNKNINVALVAVLIEAMDYPDKELPLQLLEGLPICGDIDYDSGVYRRNPPEKDAGLLKDHFEEWKTSNPTTFGSPNVRHNWKRQRERQSRFRYETTELVSTLYTKLNALPSSKSKKD